MSGRYAWICVIWLLSAALAAEDVGQRASLAVPGGIYLWEVPGGASDVRFQNRPVLRLNNQAVVGIPLSFTDAHGVLTYATSGTQEEHRFPVHPKTYTEQHITIENQAMVTPPEATLERIRSESRRQRALYLSHTERHADLARFILPVEGPISSLFGHRRFFNGQPRNPHSGLDIAAPSGTPIMAAAGGRVVLADDLYFNGNTVFLDHGEGLITMYCHMERIAVEEGATVSEGEVLGLVGATGRVTGPHLHWSVSLNGVRVDPPMFMEALSLVAGARDSQDGNRSLD